MSSFILATLPLVVFGVIITIVLTNFNSKKNKENNTESEDNF